MSPKLVVVIGATGQQGGSVVNALLNRPESYTVRAVTRNINSDKARSLASRGAEIVTGDLDNYDSILKAFHVSIVSACTFMMTDLPSRVPTPYSASPTSGPYSTRSRMRATRTTKSMSKESASLMLLQPPPPSSTSSGAPSPASITQYPIISAKAASTSTSRRR